MNHISQEGDVEEVMPLLCSDSDTEDEVICHELLSY